MMKTKLVVLVLLAAGVFAGLRSATAQAPPFTVTLDEFGKGSTTLPTGGIVPLPTPLPAPPDPLLVPGFAPTPVVYDLGVLGPVSSGDLLLEELPGTTQQSSDLLRFFNNFLYVYSDVSTSDPADAPADVGVPPLTTQFPVLILPETGPEKGVNGLFGYIPTGPAMPGFVASLGPAVKYNFISDTPEPSTIVLATVAAVGVVGFVRRRRSK